MFKNGHKFPAKHVANFSKIKQFSYSNGSIDVAHENSTYFMEEKNSV